MFIFPNDMFFSAGITTVMGRGKNNNIIAIISPCTGKTKSRQTLFLPEYHVSPQTIEGKCVCKSCTVWGLVPSEGKLCSSLWRSSNTTLSSSSSGRTDTGLLRWSDRLQTHQTSRNFTVYSNQVSLEASFCTKWAVLGVSLQLQVTWDYF